MGNRSEMTKLAAYKRLCKLASAARVAKYNSMLLKYAAAGDGTKSKAKAKSDKKKKEDSKPEAAPPSWLDAGTIPLIAMQSGGINPDDMTDAAKADVVKRLKGMATTGYVGAGVIPGITTLAGTGIGYGLGRIFGKRSGGVGAAIGGGLGLGIGALPGIGSGFAGAMASRAANRLETGSYDKALLAAQLGAMRKAEAEAKSKKTRGE